MILQIKIFIVLWSFNKDINMPTSSTRVTLAEKWGETPAILQDEKRAGNYTHLQTPYSVISMSNNMPLYLSRKGVQHQTIHRSLLLRGNFFQCHVFAMKNVQNLKYFWRPSQNYFVLALFSSL
jgi:hypothetical protein